MYGTVQNSPGHAASLMPATEFKFNRFGSPPGGLYKWRETGSGEHAESINKIRVEPPEGECMMKVENLPRRAVLRGALALGCGLLLPGLLSGCDSKRGASSAGGSAPATPPAATPSATPSAAAAVSTTPAAAGKMSQASVQYQEQPKGEQKCGDCLHFIAESSTCKLVDGQISSTGWCILWVRKA